MKLGFGLAMAAAATLLSGCIDYSWSSSDGVPLAELDTAGASPTGIALAGPDNVIVTSGSGLDIQVEGDSSVTEGLRFEIDGDTLEISREGNLRGSERATVRVTMPTPTELSLAGSGSIEVDRLGTGGDAEVSIAGSGESRATRIDADTLEVNVAGSGSIEGAGTARKLDLSIAGSGDVMLEDVKVDSAEIAIAGSGDAVFSSDGEVDASIMGSGDVRVVGSARCSVSSMGSGSVTCSGGSRGSAGDGAAASEE